MSSETAQLLGERNETEKEVKKLEQQWQDLKVDYERLEMLLEKAKQESESGNDRKISTATLKETLIMQTREQENNYSKLKNVRIFYYFQSLLEIAFILQQISHLQMSKEDRRKQIEMWTDLADLFELKKR